MDLDAALKEIGQFGLFQGYYFTLLVLPVVLSAFRGTEYVFTTMNILHRSVADVMVTVATHFLQHVHSRGATERISRPTALYIANYTNLK